MATPATAAVASAATTAGVVIDTPIPGRKKWDADSEATTQAATSPSGTATTTTAIGSAIATASMLRGR